MIHQIELTRDYCRDFLIENVPNAWICRKEFCEEFPQADLYDRSIVKISTRPQTGWNKYNVYPFSLSKGECLFIKGKRERLLCEEANQLLIDFLGKDYNGELYVEVTKHPEE